MRSYFQLEACKNNVQSKFAFIYKYESLGHAGIPGRI